ncbi:glycoside hydrolase superfamily [Lentinula edodes]|nr:glycoside hydrolase superfamily [Lentinula edodes]
MFPFILFPLFALRALCQNISALESDYQTPYTSAEPFAPYDPVRASVFRYRQQQSVNLGSWFVQEQWMVPSIFECAAEPKIAEIDIANGGCNPQGILEKHWDTFITQQDFNYLASIGINTVRLPIGYWSLGPNFVQDTPFANVSSVYENAWPHVVRAINMAEVSNIAVIVDLHGAPGSQNGQPHSGISDGKANLCANSTYQEKTLQVVQHLATELCFVSNVAGVQILNEPEDCSELTNFCEYCVSDESACSLPDFPVYLHDAFDLDRFKDYVSAKVPDFSIQDHHSYYVYTPQDDVEPAENHTTDVQTTVTSQLASANDTLPHNLIIGEWSCALTPDSLKNESDPQQARRDFCTAQYVAYTRDTPGNSFWSYKKEDCDPDWCFLNAVNNSLPSSFFSYGSGPITSEQYHMIQLLEPEIVVLTAGNLVSRRDNTISTSSEASPSRYRHRSHAIAHRRQFSGQNISSSTSTLSPGMKDYQNGYQEGFITAQKFALYGGSRLGFLGQYLWTGISGSGDSSWGPEGGSFRQGFVQGLRDAEDKISGITGQL